MHFPSGLETHICQTAVNERLAGEPGLINEDPYGDGWIYEVSLSNKTELGGLLSAEAYADLLQTAAD